MNICEELVNKAKTYEDAGSSEMAGRFYLKAAKCYEAREFFDKASEAYESASNAFMTAGMISYGAKLLTIAADTTIKMGNYENYENLYGKASAAYEVAVETENDNRYLIDAAFCSLLAADDNEASRLIGLAEKSLPEIYEPLIKFVKELANMNFKAAYDMIRNYEKYKIPKWLVKKIRDYANNLLAAYIRNFLMVVEPAISINALCDLTGEPRESILQMVEEAVLNGLIPAKFDINTHELIVDKDHLNIDTLGARPIQASDYPDE